MRLFARRLAMASVLLVGCISLVASSSTCPSGTTIFFVNGVWNTTYKSALQSLYPLESYTSAPNGSSPYEYELAYNPSDGYLSDLVESAGQKYGTNLDWVTFGLWVTGEVVATLTDQAFTQDLGLPEIQKFLLSQTTRSVLQQHVLLYRAAMSKGQKVIAVAHSQGNFFANSAVENLIDGLTFEEQLSFTIVSVANPDNHIATSARSLKPVTLSEDSVIKLVPSAMPAEYTNGPFSTPNGDFAKHQFVTTYLEQGYSLSIPRDGPLNSLGAILDRISAADLVTSPPQCSTTPSTPTLLTPINGAAIPQNNPNIGCSFIPFRGYGLQIPFDWTDSVSSDGIAGYDIFAERVGATLPIVQTFVSASNYTTTSCNTFVIDQNLDNWQWRVRAKSNTGVYGPWSDTGVFSFQPCRLSNGSACSASSSFFDDFNRADGPVGNGWSDTAGNINGSLVIRNNAVAASNMDGFAGIFRPMDVSKSLTVTATITPGYGCCPSPDRFDAYFVIGNNGATHNGYGIQVGRSDAAYNNSSVSLVHNGTFLFTIPSPFQFSGSLTVTVTISPDGSVSGSAVGAGGTFPFSFGAQGVILSGSHFEFETGFTDSRGSTSPTYPTMDNISISQ